MKSKGMTEPVLWRCHERRLMISALLAGRHQLVGEMLRERLSPPPKKKEKDK